MGGTKGVSGTAGLAGLGAGMDILAQGGSVKDAMIAGGAGAASSAIGAGATAALAATPLAPLAPILGPLIGQVVVGAGMKALGIGTWSKSKKRKKAMKAFKSAVSGGSLSSFGSGNTLMKSIINDDGSTNEGSKRKTLTEMATILGGKGMNVTPSEVEPLMWALIATKNAEIASQLGASPFEILRAWDDEIKDQQTSGARTDGGGGGRGPTAAKYNAGAKTSGTVAGLGSGSGSGGGGSGRSPALGGGESDVVASLERLRADLANRDTNISIDMDGKKVAQIVTSNQEELSVYG